MLHTISDRIHISRFGGITSLEVGEYYALLSDMSVHCFVHVLEHTNDFYTVDALYVYHPRKAFRLWHTWIKSKKITAELFQQVVERYDNCIKEVFSIDFEKTPLESINYVDECYYTFNKRTNSSIFARLIDDLQSEDIVVDPEGHSFVFNTYFTEDLSSKDLYYSIDPTIYQKVKKMYDILSHTLKTLINSCLE